MNSIAKYGIKQGKEDGDGDNDQPGSGHLDWDNRDSLCSQCRIPPEDHEGMRRSGIYPYKIPLSAPLTELPC